MDHHKQFHKYNCYGTVTAGEKIAGDAMELVTIFLHAMFKAFNICTRYQGIVNHEDKELHSELWENSRTECSGNGICITKDIYKYVWGKIPRTELTSEHCAI